MAVFVNVHIIVKAHKITILYLPINSKSGHYEEQTRQYIVLFEDQFFATIINYGHGQLLACIRDDVDKIRQFIFQILTRRLVKRDATKNKNEKAYSG